MAQNCGYIFTNSYLCGSTVDVRSGRCEQHHPTFSMFLREWERGYRTDRATHPDRYQGDPDEVIARMRAAWANGTASKDGSATAFACRQLGIPVTYKAIQALPC